MKSPFANDNNVTELNDEQKSEALYVLHVCAQAVRQRLLKFHIER